MTIKIEIEVPSDLVLKGAGSRYLDQAAGALGWSRHATPNWTVAVVDKAPANTGRAEAVEDVTDESGVSVGAGAAPLVEEAAEQTATQIDKRPVGSPAEGNKRRNSAEKVEDDEFEALAASKGVALDKLNAGIAAAGRAEAKAQLSALDVADKHVDESQAAISTGEERIGPEDEQDAADEAAETEKSGLAPIDVLRRLLGDYQKAHGMPAAVKLCQDGGLIGKPINDLDDAGIEAAIAAMRGVSPLSPETKAEDKPEETVAPKTKADLIEAMMRYGDKFDGTREQAKMTNTLSDCPRIFVEVFGDAVTKLSLVPENGYGKAVAAIEQAIATDPFGRAK